MEPVMPGRVRFRRSLALAAAVLVAGRTLSAQKTRSIEVSGIPALNFDADEGFGYGAVLALYGYDSTRSTYRWTLQPTVFLTTEGRRDYTLFYDAPSRPGRAWRVTAFAGREQQLAAPYYGIGNVTPYDPTLERGSTRYYYRYGHARNRASLDLQHALWRPSVRVLIGAGASSETVNLTPFDSGTTLIARDLSNVTPPRQRTNFVRAGLTWDTRDREIGTETGTWADAIVQRVDKSLGATTDYTRWTATVRHYQPLGSRVTFANRLLAQNVVGDAPFYALGEIQTAQKPQDGLGGASTVRGLPKDRYVGKGIVVSNNELRWRAASFGLAGRPSSLILSAFADAGRVWATGIDAGSLFDEVHAGYGGGARISFGPSFVVAVDMGHSSEATAPMYIGLGYMF
jgi:outer membrane protein assembly factor BamA